MRAAVTCEAAVALEVSTYALGSNLLPATTMGKSIPPTLTEAGTGPVKVGTCEALVRPRVFEKAGVQRKAMPLATLNASPEALVTE